MARVPPFPYTLDTINPDGMMVDDLELFNGHLATVQSYCVWKALAMRERIAGNVNVASAHEKRCDDLYATLPENWKW